MDKLLIGDVIYRLRKEKGITQDQLANFIGVSTAAVSKWESRISYPDITLLPVLATFFNVTIDKLLDFKIELTDNEIMNIFIECEKLFSSGELQEATNRSKDYISKYPNSYYLKLRIGFLFNMYSWKSADKEAGMKMIEYSIELFEDVAQNCSKVELVEQALFQLGAYYPTIGKEDKAIEALNRIHKSELDPDVLLAYIYINRNELKEARKMLQSKLYKGIDDIGHACIGLANSYMKDEKDFAMAEKYHNLYIDIRKVFSNGENSVLGFAFEYLNFAHTCLMFNEAEKAINILNKMIEDIEKNDINTPQKFSSIWCFNEIPEGKRTITMNLYENLFKVLEAPEFDLIRERPQFINIKKDLKILEKKSLEKK
ncbi:helix-turn-helix domain-containing protein [Clostridium thailandense]|uniref:helix-turn-helix domain-containing protein n=1 Tax=Clostridium thailandense TaxID=2794346 RepID=UPI003988E8A6